MLSKGLKEQKWHDWVCPYCTILKGFFVLGHAKNPKFPSLVTISLIFPSREPVDFTAVLTIFSVAAAFLSVRSVRIFILVIFTTKLRNYMGISTQDTILNSDRFVHGYGN